MKNCILTALTFADITSQETATFKTIELSPHFNTVIERYQFMCFPKGGLTDEELRAEQQSYLNKWADVLEKEKGPRPRNARGKL